MPYEPHTNITWCTIGVLVSLVLLSNTRFLQAEQTNHTLPPAPRMAFFAGLEGPWEGQAKVTPLGPRPYDITYVRTAPRRVEGQAHPGASTHFWTFYEEQDTLKLRFLSTFAGNQQPLLLTGTREHPSAFVFRTPQPRFVEVHVFLQAHTVTKKIFLRGQPHVEIHLTRRPHNTGSVRKDSPTP